MKRLLAAVGLGERREEKRILIVGGMAAGKTTFLYRVYLGEVVTTIPTAGFNIESVQHG
eukprot:CAMPEP_0175925130 /NCGR_PEP_ID=MMETSP0108-20121206/15481_1 /TAXON_ID=195067 ORGANISM="Goniomonas pacifica, Strain CCMP1869" /NCGR_SAMPLE_ID=MMETSP0108 /ASSEMBLY_ACC=CAM_ASM_000204 /LENGTH=58 /DNA_ID=CAMNT_0017248259 /DNA_START=10 /DNA_END=182 /DNA_ORIENTATION=+